MQTLIKTIEIRWFESGELPAQVKDWFKLNCLGELQGSPEEREDLYLYLPQCHVISLKRRQERLELKWRKDELGILSFGNAWQGIVERWLKLSHQDSVPLNVISMAVGEEKTWVAVKKVRWQRLYQGINCELSQLTIQEQPWWSIAFEMIEQEANQEESFAQAINSMSQTYHESALTSAQSYGYPGWLAELGIGG